MCTLVAAHVHTPCRIQFGVEPAVKRIGEFKTFGDAYSRDSMSAAQREVSTNLLETVSGFKTGLLARSSGKSMAEVEALYDSDVSGSVGGARCFRHLQDSLSSTLKKIGRVR